MVYGLDQCARIAHAPHHAWSPPSKYDAAGAWEFVGGYGRTCREWVCVNVIGEPRACSSASTDFPSHIAYSAMTAVGRKCLLVLAAVFAVLQVSGVCWGDETEEEDAGSCTNAVSDLTDENFQEEIKNAEMMFVMFYTPW